MTWWQWAIGVVEFGLTWKATDLYVMRNHPTRIQARKDRREHRAAELARQRPVFDIPSCRYCGRVAFSIYPNGVGPMCQVCLNERYSPTPVASAFRDFTRYQPPGVYESSIQQYLDDVALQTNHIAYQEFENQYRRLMDL